MSKFAQYSDTFNIRGHAAKMNIGTNPPLFLFQICQKNRHEFLTP